jgi:hypothetical protein
MRGPPIGARCRRARTLCSYRLLPSLALILLSASSVPPASSGAGAASAAAASSAAASSPAAPVNKNKRYRKEKPWDNAEIDHWAIPKVTADDPLDAPLEESSFATLFPKYREKYLREVWPLVTKSVTTRRTPASVVQVVHCMHDDQSTPMLTIVPLLSFFSLPQDAEDIRTRLRVEFGRR